ncbi:mRNA-decapping enzyme-like protein-like isoform X3 [Tripterygium wilfordii]|uniref:mRNA-decapping enzyme-like protein-like isoform X3 n=1 Tax=Tripterygium wilfordii TaxID=458696 RepID=A0A7J7DYK0_TRIWF|nr:mRNA-decapping enzyme-like protein-like isoform X3 [Tripterygium wilfordii]
MLEDFEDDIQVPYLLYRNVSQEVNGIWFYNAQECEEVANHFSRYRIEQKLPRRMLQLQNGVDINRSERAISKDEGSNTDEDCET